MRIIHRMASRLDGAFDLVIRGATIYDGTGAAGIQADIGLRGDRVAAIESSIAQGSPSFDAAGLAVAPGFIDVHSHDDFAVLLDPLLPFKVLRGVTTDIVGNCGSGVVPFEAGLIRFRRLHPDANPAPWDGFGGYFQRVEDTHPALNVAALVGHGSLRRGAMGLAQRAPTLAELDQMCDWVSEGMQAGALGLSTGLSYEPGRYAATEELVTLAKRAGASGGLYVSHIRNEGAGLLDAVREAIQIGEEAGVAVQISHHKASGRGNWGRTVESLAMLDGARLRGVDVTADQYPYTAGSTTLFAIVQNGAFGSSGGSGGPGATPPESVLIASSPGHAMYEGRTIADLMEQWGTTAEATARRLIEEEGEALFVVVFSMHETDVRRVMAHPTTMIGSDGIPAVGGKPHPRLWGCFARVLGHYVRDEHVLDMPTAIHKMTGLPARKFGLVDRGVVRPGAVADLVVFDPVTIREVGNFTDPARPPEGIRSVMVNGIEVARDGVPTGARPGRVVRPG